ncbi:MAG: DUF983 domain-containing protein [Alphaproteobacteria bacterium]
MPGGSPPPSPWATGLRCACPACGAAPLFQGFLQVRKNCPACGADLSGQDSGDGPVPFVIFLVGAIVVGLALVTEVRYEPPVWLHLVLWLPLTVLLVLVLMRPAKALMIAFQYKHRPQDFESGG